MDANEFLTQDIDILPEAETKDEDAMTDMFPDTPADESNNVPAEEAAAPEAEVKTEEASTEEKPKDTSEPDSELQELLSGLEDSTEESTETTSTANEAIDSVKQTVEEIKENPAAATSDELVNSLYTEVLKAEAALQAKSVAEEVALSKVSELQAKITEMEINNAGVTNTDNPQVMILNSLIDSAVSGSDTAKGKVKGAIEKLYMELFDTSIE